MKEVIGEIIRESVKRSGLTQEDFAREMGMTHRNLANLLNKDRIPFEQLVRASKILKEDFIKKYTSILYDEEVGLQEFKKYNFEESPALSKVPKEKTVSVSLIIRGEINKISKSLPDLLVIINREVEARGLQLI